MDPQAHELAKARLASAREANGWEVQLAFSQMNYSQIREGMPDATQHSKADAILLDLGTSSMQVPRPLLCSTIF